MKKRLLALLCALLLCGRALADNADQNDARYYYQVDSLHTHLLIAPGWETLVTETSCVFPYETSVGENVGSCVFYYLDDKQAAADYAYALSLLPEQGVALAGIVMYPAGGQPQDAGLEGFAYQTVYEGESFCIASAWAEELALEEGTPLDLLEALVASYRDTDAYILVVEPATTLGEFATTDLYGAEYTSSIFSQAQLTLVNVWATYCSPCLQEMPCLGELAQEYADQGVQIIGIPVDIFLADGSVDEEQLALAQRYAESTGATYPHLIADDVMQQNLLRDVYYVPNTWFFDSDGNLLGETLVGSYSKEDWAAQIEAHLALLEED